MDRYLKVFEPEMKKWLAAHYAPEDAAARWGRTVALDEQWIREEGDLGGKKNVMSKNLLEAYAFFAFYEAVDRTFAREDLDGMIEAAMGKSLQIASRFDMNRLENKRWLIRLIYRIAGHYAKKADRHRGGDWGNTWTLHINPDHHGKGIGASFTTCPINDFARKHGYIDFLPNLCRIDQRTAHAMHAALIRHRTLANGDGECNYWYVGDKSPEGLADSGSL